MVKFIQSNNEVFLSIRDCQTKFNLNLLYNTRPKVLNERNYSIRIDMFNKLSLKYRSSWLFPLQFIFLPVQRLSVQLIIRENDDESIDNCSLKCVHGLCRKYVNRFEYYCQCNEHWSGLLCEINHRCDCGRNSLCINFVHNRSICVCSIDKFGRFCRLKYSTCETNPCQHGGTCIPTDYRLSETNFTCICDENHSGLICERTNTKITISFSKEI